MRHKSHATEAFAKLPKDVRAGSVQSMVAIIRLDDGGGSFVSETLVLFAEKETLCKNS